VTVARTSAQEKIKQHTKKALISIGVEEDKPLYLKHSINKFKGTVTVQ